jgi:hypothetical protein
MQDQEKNGAMHFIKSREESPTDFISQILTKSTSDIADL